MTFVQVGNQIVNLAQIEVARIDQNNGDNDDSKPHVFVGLASGEEIAFKGEAATWLWNKIVLLCESRVFKP